MRTLWPRSTAGSNFGAVLTSVPNRVLAFNVPQCKILVDVGVADRVVEMAGRDGPVAVGQRDFEDAHLIFSADMSVEGNPQWHL